MDCRSPLRMKLLIVILLISTNIVCLQGYNTTGADLALHCVTDYLYTINCSLGGLPLDSNNSYWLTFTYEAYEDGLDTMKEFVCLLNNTDGKYFCTYRHYTMFIDLDGYEISLCYNQTDGYKTCKQLVELYEPVYNIKPNVPRCLTVRHNASEFHFTWRSTYEEFSSYNNLYKELKYQLQYYKRDTQNEPSRVFLFLGLDFSADDTNFEPDTKYAARVRSIPDGKDYRGEWSDWSPEVHWKTEAAANDSPSNTSLGGLGKVLIPLFVVVPFTLIFCWSPIKKWKQGVFIPTPAPYFHTLYNECQGDFKSWVVTHKHTADMLKTESTLQIDTLTKCEVVEEKEECQPQIYHHFPDGSAYGNISDPGCDASMLGVPYAVSTMNPPSSYAESSDEGDSGCWLERDPPWYCNEYCTLSTFQLGSPVTAEDHESFKSHTCPT
ncbi:hypothetical protein PBY51_001540 [Eleginops maclovinus]|uniref:Fibronectin type-III domain-containing protein n=1 Tax=Eleginops maclovinus TaxID=56733 RepID=A0AAN7WWM0_ELEMC|nr:hypothetical protein PBY51_001540 [Eleginops maclovinus]